MSKESDGGCVLLAAGCAFYLAAASLAMAVAAITRFTLIVIGIYFAAWILLPLAILPLADILRRRADARQHARATRNAIARSPFPRHSYLTNKGYLDNLIWEFTEWSIGERTRSASSLRHEHSTLLRQELLRNPREFEKWRQEKLYEVLHDPYNRNFLVMKVYREVAKLLPLYLEASVQASWKLPFLKALGVRIEANKRPLPKWFLRDCGIHFLSFRVLAPSISQPVQLSFKEKVAYYMNNKEVFYQLLDRHLFEIMGELDPFPFFPAQKALADAHSLYDRERKARAHFTLSKQAERKRLSADNRRAHHERSEKQRKERQKRQTEALVKREEEYEVHAQQLTREARRQEFLKGFSPNDLFAAFSEGTSQFVPEITELATEEAEWDAARTEERLEQLKTRRPEFLEFWQKHEEVILERYYERKDREVRQEALAEKELSEALKLDELASDALACARRELGKLKRDEHVPVDPRFGLLLAVARQAVKRHSRDAPTGSTIGHIEREIYRLLEEPSPEDRFFAPRIHEALIACEHFRHEAFIYAEEVERAGYTKGTDRDTLAIAFVDSLARIAHSHHQKRPLKVI